MSRAVWDDVGERRYETGTDRGMLYPMKDDGTYDKGVVWNGLTTVTETPEGGETTDIYADNIKYLSLIGTESFGGTIEAYSYPEEFEKCDGTADITTGVKAGQQTRKAFGFAYRTRLGNDVAGNEYGYKLHLVYCAKANPSSRSYTTINESPEAITFSWEFKSTPTPFKKRTDLKPVSLITIDSTKVNSSKLTDLENMLYGVDADPEHSIEASDPTFPTPDQVVTLFNAEVVG